MKRKEVKKAIENKEEVKNAPRIDLSSIKEEKPICTEILPFNRRELQQWRVKNTNVDNIFEDYIKKREAKLSFLEFGYPEPDPNCENYEMLLKIREMLEARQYLKFRLKSILKYKLLIVYKDYLRHMKDDKLTTYKKFDKDHDVCSI